jgi:CheY-like chemotaxis protein
MEVKTLLDKEKVMEKKKVLLVDDVGLFLQLEETFFKRKNCIILTAKSGEEALKIIKENKPDLIVLDFYMPGMNGDEVCRIIKSDERFKDVPIIMVSKSSKTEDIEKCLKAGCNHYVTKPIKQTELLDKAAELMNIPVRRSMRIFVKIEVVGTSKTESFFGRTENISTDGIFIICDKNLEYNSHVVIKFFLPGSKDEIVVKGIIVRIEPSKNIGYGIKFTELSEDNKNKLENFINDL